MRAPGTVCQTIQSMQTPHTIDMYSKGAIVDAGARRNASVMRCWPAQPASPSSAIQVQSCASMAIQPRAARAPAPSGRQQQEPEHHRGGRLGRGHHAQHHDDDGPASAAASAASPARLTKPDAVGFEDHQHAREAGEDRDPDVPVRLLAAEKSTANGTTSSGALSVIA